MKVVMISRAPVGSYTSKLVKGFSKSCAEDRVLVYGRRGEVRTEQYIRLVGVWTSGLYPFQIFRQLCRDKPEITHIQHEFGMFGNPLTLFLAPLLYIFLKFLRVRVVTTLHSMVFPDSLSKDSITALLPSLSWMPKTFVEVGLHVVYGTACRLSSMVIVHQQSHMEKLERYYRIRRTKISFIPHGVGPTEYGAGQETLSVWRSKLRNKRIILYFGYISPRKGIEYLIDAFETFSKQRPEWMLVLAGGLSKKYYMPYCTRIVETVREKNLSNRVAITGFVSESDADALYRLCDFVVLPYTQVVGNASPCNLAMGYGKPIIATKLSPFTEEIEDFRHGILCPPEDSAQLLSAIEKLSSDPRLYRDICNNLQRCGKMRDWETAASETEKLYTMALTRQSQTLAPGNCQ